MSEHSHLEGLLAALDASPLALRRDACGAYAINGKSGHIYADGPGFLLCVSTGESARLWGFVKKRLAFCQLRQDGEDEGCLYLDRLPTPGEAEAIRDDLGIRKRRHLSDEALAALERARGSVKRDFQPRTFAGTAGPVPEALEQEAS
jgi:hypothetical protein